MCVTRSVSVAASVESSFGTHVFSVFHFVRTIIIVHSEVQRYFERAASDILQRKEAPPDKSHTHNARMSRLDPLWHALSKLRRGKYEECIAICDEILANNPNDQVTNTFRTLRKLSRHKSNSASFICVLFAHL